MSIFDSDTARWYAVQNRERAGHSAFVYAVSTTKIFCRPTCPARLARRANVKFFDQAADALKNGFRPCKRCKPDESTGSNTSSRIIPNACKYILQVNGDLTTASLAEHVGISSRHLHTLFKGAMGCTPAAYAAQVRKSNRLQPECTAPSSSSTKQVLQPATTGIFCQDLPILDMNAYSSASSYANIETLFQDIENSNISSPSTESALLTPQAILMLDTDLSCDNYEAFIHDYEEIGSYDLDIVSDWTGNDMLDQV